MSIRVIVVDDSSLMRRLLQARLAREDDIEVVACASDASEARKLIKALDPDVVTLDIEMPGMDGLTFLQKIMELRPTPVIIVSGSTQEGTTATARALKIGAVGCYAKSDRYGEMPDDDGGRLAAMVREAAAVPMKSPVRLVNPAPSRKADNIGLIAIGSSTGGVEALHTLLADFPENCPPTLVVQHVNATFSGAIAQSLDSVSDAKVSLAKNGDLIKPGNIYLAPGGDRHLLVARGGANRFQIELRPGAPVSGHIPSVDALFQSVSTTYGARANGIILTGMGRDGAKGLDMMAKAGSHTIAQDEESCIVFGMPRAAIELGAVSAVLPLNKIAGHLFHDALALT